MQISTTVLLYRESWDFEYLKDLCVNVEGFVKPVTYRLVQKLPNTSNIAKLSILLIYLSSNFMPVGLATRYS